MKRIVSSLTLLLSLTAASQNRVAIFAGPQASTANYSIQNQKQDTKMKYGFNAGVAMKVPFDGFLYFAPAAFYSCLLYTSPSPRDRTRYRMPSSA